MPDTYLIITPSDLKPAIQQLINQKNSRGFNVEIFNPESFRDMGILVERTGKLKCSKKLFDPIDHPGGNAKYLVADLDGDGKKEIVITANEGEFIGYVKEDGGTLKRERYITKYIHHPGGNDKTGWHLRPGDKFIVGDFNGDGKDRIVVASSNGKWIGILYTQSDGKLVAGWIGKNYVVNHHGGSVTSGWHLRKGDSFLAADIDGNGKDEIIVTSQNGKWIGILRQQGDKLVAGHIKSDFIIKVGGSRTSGWHLREGDTFIAADINGDGKKEIIARNREGDWLGVIKLINNELHAHSVIGGWVNHEGGSGNTGWKLSSGDKFFAANITNDSKEELVVLNKNSKWLGYLYEKDGKLCASKLNHNWVNHLNQTGQNGWNMGQYDYYKAADIDNDGKDELIVCSHSRNWIGILKVSNKKFYAGWVKRSPVKDVSGIIPNDWNMKRGDRIVAADINGDGRDELIIVHETPCYQLMRRQILNKSPRPKYMLFVGDYDRTPGYPLTDRHVPDEPNKYLSDSYYSTPNGDVLAKIATGRLSSNDASTNGELRRICKMLVEYPNHPSPLWKKRVIMTGWLPRMTSTVGDAAWDCIREIGDQYQLIYEFEKTRNTSSAQQRFWGAHDSTKQSLCDAMSRSALIVRYLGHGAHEYWANTGNNGSEHSSECFYDTDVHNLTSGNKVPFVISATCNTGHIKKAPSLAEAFLIYQKGIGVFAADTKSSTYFNDRVTQVIFNKIVSGGKRRIGDILKSTMSKMKNIGETNNRGDSYWHTMKMYRYIGDPDTILSEFDPDKTTLSERTNRIPAITTKGNRILLSWTGTDRNLNFMKSSNGKSFSNKVTLSIQSATSPALCTFNNNYYVAWVDNNDKRINIMRSSNGTSWTTRLTQNELSSSCPSIVEFNNKLYLAWRDSNDKINILESTDGANFTNKRTHSDTSKSGPSLAATDTKMFIAWRGKNNNYLNVKQSPNGVNFTNKTVLGDITSSRPFIFTMDDRIYLAWKGHGNQHLNCLESKNGTDWIEKLTLTEKSPVGPSLGSLGSKFIWCWRGVDDRINSILYTID